jgi:DNA-binding response OmpR family regulator
METATKHTVLLVEDEASLALPLSSALEHEGYTVMRAETAEKGLEVALAEHPDITLADLHLPGMSGLEMIAEIRRDSWGKDAEIIILTNASDEKSIEDAMTHGVFYYINKGYSSMKDILEKVQARLEARTIGNSEREAE